MYCFLYVGDFILLKIIGAEKVKGKNNNKGIITMMTNVILNNKKINIKLHATKPHACT